MLKKMMLAVLLGLGTATAAVAVPAYPFPFKTKQADGAVLTIKKLGDEHWNAVTTADGYPLFLNATTGNYEYARLSDGRLAGTGIVATEADARTPQAIAYLQTVDAEQLLETDRQTRLSQPGSGMRKGPRGVRISDYPTLGHQKTLIILVEFQDVKFSVVGDAYTYYNNMLNQEGFTHENGAHGSARDFYLASSAGSFDPEFVVAGPVTVAENCSYYGKNGAGGDIDVKIGDMIVDACMQLDGEIDYSEFDADGDGYVDNIYFFYAGYGEADSNAQNVIWPHSYELESGWGRELVLDGVHISRYATSNEINGQRTSYPVGIGTFVHEFGHVLGLADHYNTAYSWMSADPGSWDTMASGSYNDNQNTPPTFSAFERAELNWMDYTDIEPDVAGFISVPVLQDHNQAYRIVVPGTDGNEYFIMENRQQAGWDRYLPGHGMLVWHVDMDEEAWLMNRVNTNPSHQRLDIVEADGSAGSALSGDPFPGARDVRQFTFDGWSQRDVFSFEYVDERDDDVRFLLGGSDYRLDTPQLTVSSVTGKHMTVDWQPVELAIAYTLTVAELTAEGDTVPLRAYDERHYAEPATVTISSLTPQTNYLVRLTARLGTLQSEPADATVTTTEPTFAETQPRLTGAADVSGTGFTVTWEPVSGADDYQLSLALCGDLAEGTTDYGFDDGIEGMPAGWETSSVTLNHTYSGESAPSLELNAEDDYISFDGGEAQLTSLSFWYRTKSLKNWLYVEEFIDGEWLEAQSFKTQASGRTITVPLSGQHQARIRLQSASYFVAIDDIQLGYTSIPRLDVSGYTGVSAGSATRYTFAGLQPGRTYAVRLTALADGQSSEQSDELLVELPTTAAIDGVSATAPDVRATYDLTGRPVSAAARGLLLQRRSDGTVRKTLR